MSLYIVLAIIVIIGLSSFTFLKSKPFGALPKGERLERVLHSPNFRDGEFKNEENTILMTNDSAKVTSKWENIWNFIVSKKPEGLIPQEGQLTVCKPDIKHLGTEDLYIWFGHSSYLLQLSGKTFLIDPVFYKGSPVSFVNKAFKSADVFRPKDMPDKIDYLIISHDHWDHLDYETVSELKPNIGKVICPLGVGAHFERWGFPADMLIELDWQEDSPLSYPTDSNEYKVTCLPTRHFSGRGLKSNQSLWASFMLQTPSGTVYIGGDGGYDGRFKRIRAQYPKIDLAILENGQYDKRWAQIHTLPSQLKNVMQELGARLYITVHHSKFCLANHPWDEPLKNELEAAQDADANLSVVQIGEIQKLELK